MTAPGTFESDADAISPVAEQPQRRVIEMRVAGHRARGDRRGRRVWSGIRESRLEGDRSDRIRGADVDLRDTGHRGGRPNHDPHRVRAGVAFKKNIGAADVGQGSEGKQQRSEQRPQQIPVCSSSFRHAKPDEWPHNRRP